MKAIELSCLLYLIGKGHLSCRINPQIEPSTPIKMLTQHLHHPSHRPRKSTASATVVLSTSPSSRASSNFSRHPNYFFSASLF